MRRLVPVPSFLAASFCCLPHGGGCWKLKLVSAMIKRRVRMCVSARRGNWVAGATDFDGRAAAGAAVFWSERALQLTRRGTQSRVRDLWMGVSCEGYGVACDHSVGCTNGIGCPSFSQLSWRAAAMSRRDEGSGARSRCKNLFKLHNSVCQCIWPHSLVALSEHSPRAASTSDEGGAGGRLVELGRRPKCLCARHMHEREFGRAASAS